MSRLVPSLTPPTAGRVEPFSALQEPDDEQATGLYVLGGTYYLISTTCTVSHVYPIVRPKNESCLPDSWAGSVSHVYPTENRRIHSPFVENSPPARAEASTHPQEPRARRGRPPKESHRPAERPTAALRRRERAVSSDPDPDSLHSRHPVPTGPTTSVDEGRTYSLMRRSCDGGIRGGDGSMTSPPVTMR